jgi:PAS domain S-box-containing protein
LISRKAAFVASRQRTQLWEAALTRAPWAVQIGSADGNVVLAVNPTFEEMHGYSQDELHGRPIEELYAPECRADALARLGRVTSEGQQVFESVHLRKDGTRFPVLVDAAPFCGSDGRLYQAVHVLDLSHLRAAQHSRVDLGALYRVLAEAASDAIVTIDVHSTILFANSAVERVFGYAPGEVLGRRLTMLMPEYLRRVHEASLARYLATGVRHLDWHAVEVPGLHKEGREILLEVSFGESGKGDDRTFTGVIRDVTVRKQTEEHLRQTQRLEAIGQLAGGMAHEVNNQMTIVLGVADFLSRRTDLPAEVREDVEHVRRAAAQSAAITSQLLAFGRRQLLRPEIVATNSVVQEFEPILRRSIGAANKLQLNLSPRAGQVEIDRGQIEQVMLNLALNAAHAMGTGGTLTVETDRLEAGEVQADVSMRPGEYTVIRFKDTGHGMDRTTLKRIFEPFFTTKKEGEGTGLGLSTAYGIIKQSGGYIWAESEPGRGTTLWIQLPIVTGPTDAGTASLQALRARGLETVLVIEDDPSVRQMLLRGLALAGYQTVAASSGEAVEELRRHSGRISLIVSDLTLREMSAQDLFAKLREIRTRLPLLAISGHPYEDLRKRGLLGRDVPFLQKPFSPELLASRVRQLLDER